MIATEQNPKRLGETVHELKGVLPKDFKYFQKMKFSMMSKTKFHLNQFKF